MGSPLIGVTTRTYFIRQGAGEPQSEVNLAACTYIRAVEQAGGVPVLLPLVADEEAIRRLLDLVGGVILTGGWDIDPGLYGQEPHEMLQKIDVRKDEMERVLADMLLDEPKPVLAICRGAGMLNIAAGGTLHQDISLAVEKPVKHDYHSATPTAAHSVRIEARSRLARIVGGTELRVNSLHHQCIARLAERFVPTAHAPDGVLEAFEDQTHPFLLGVQWHPEDLVHEAPSAALFAALVQASS
ncbi:MAG: gamma-glutamyl-gamma-aminobutyrate hydrolase family protein [Verrucomicrobia bacterium]|nr:gamma-glutamyl-gamma-aminobutyrate hydrolase family protein [Verrucomicrobiota bacterium]